MRKRQINFSRHLQKREWPGLGASFREATRYGLVLSVVHYSIAITTCARARRGALARKFFDAMVSDSVQPDVILYNAMIDMCMKAKPAMWQQALQHLRDLQQAALKADAVSYNPAITACARASEYQQALDLLRKMRNGGIMPSLITYSAVIDACGKSDPAQ